MSYFNSFPLVLYDMKGDQRKKLVTDIIKRVKVRHKILDASSLYQKYFVVKGERPEDVAFKHFGKSDLHWVILLVNDIVDRFHQWPMTVPQFEKFVIDKYDNPDALHHYEISQVSGDTTTTINIGTDNTGHPTASNISNRQFEEAQQLIYSQIRLLKTEFLEKFIEEFENLVEEGVDN